MLQISNSEKKPQYIITGTLITAILLSIYAVQLSVPVIGDETVTMGNVAWLEGYDWSFMIAALGGLYYRYAQALMTIPFFKCFTDPADIYRWSMVLQAVIQSSIVPVVYVICRTSSQSKRKRRVCSGWNGGVSDSVYGIVYTLLSWRLSFRCIAVVCITFLSGNNSCL